MFKKKRKSSEPKAVSLTTVMNKKSPISEQYRTIRTNIQYAMVDQDIQTLIVTSALAGEGKSTTAANLAVVFANTGIRVLLVDADMRKATTAKTFLLKNDRGLSTLLSDRTLAVTGMAQETEIDNLDVLTSGPKPPNPSELLGSNRMVGIIEEMKKDYDLVLFDMPPVVAVTDAQVLASRTDAAIMVIREKVADKQALIKAKQLLEIVDTKIIGAVYNGTSQKKDQGYYYYGA